MLSLVRRTPLRAFAGTVLFSVCCFSVVFLIAGPDATQSSPASLPADALHVAVLWLSVLLCRGWFAWANLAPPDSVVVRPIQIVAAVTLAPLVAGSVVVMVWFSALSGTMRASRVCGDARPPLKWSASGRPPGPGWRHAVSSRRPWPGILPSALA
jgi:hypothetical protein